jgi:hypothetical protein
MNQQDTLFMIIVLPGVIVCLLMVSIFIILSPYIPEEEWVQAREDRPVYIEKYILDKKLDRIIELLGEIDE